MATHQAVKDKYPGDYEEGNTSTEEGKTNQSIYMFHESEKGRNSLVVSKLNLDSLSAHIVAKRKQDYVCRRGYAAYGSRIYAIGGEYTKGGGEPLDVHVFDQSTGQWEKGPLLRSGKPNPVVVVAKGKIYALAGRSRYNGPPYSPSTILFEALDMAPSPGTSELSWINLPDPPFSHLYPKFGEQVIDFYTVSDETIFFVLKKCWEYIGVMLWSFDVDELEWTDHTHTGGEDPMPENIKNYYWVPMNSDIFDDVLYMCYANTDSPGVKFIALDLLETQKYPKDIRVTDADYNLAATNVGDKLFWSVDRHSLGVNSLLPCLVIPLKIKPTKDPRFLILVTHVVDAKFVVLCSYYTKHKKIGRGKRVVYSCLLELVGEGKLSKGIQFPSNHAVILKQKYQTMSSQLNVLTAWSKGKQIGVHEEKVEKDENQVSKEVKETQKNDSKITQEVNETHKNVSEITEEVKEAQKDDSNITEEVNETQKNVSKITEEVKEAKNKITVEVKETQKDDSKITEEVNETQENVSEITEEVKEAQNKITEEVKEAQKDDDDSIQDKKEAVSSCANSSVTKETAATSPVEVPNLGANSSKTK